jgi:hypothetical protein
VSEARHEAVKIQWVTETVKRAEALLDVSRDLNMSEQAKDLEEIISVVDRPLEKLMSYVALLH